MKNEIIIDRLVDDWRSAGVEDGDILLLHSSLGRTFRRILKLGGQINPNVVIESFLRALGGKGTLLLPLFNFDFAQGVRFDIRNTPSHMGSITEAGRLWPGAIRTGHPIYSFAAIGGRSYLFEGVNNFSGYGGDSPFAILHQNGGKIGVIDLPDQNSMTFYHYVEESLNAPYRYHKEFLGSYVDANGVESIRGYGMFVRNIEQGVVTAVDPMGEILWDKGFYTGFRPKDGCGMRVISTRNMFDEVSKVLNDGRARGLLYEVA